MESVFHLVGSCGCFQISHILLIQHIRFSVGMVLYLMVFGNYEPPWRCVKHTHNHSNVTLSNSTADGDGYRPSSGDIGTVDAMPPDGLMSIAATSWAENSTVTYEHHNDTRVLYQGTCSEVKHCEEVEFDPTSVTLVSDFGLICDRAYIPSLIIALQMTGMLFGANIGGQIGELFGRKISMYANLVVISVATLIAAWSTSWEMHAALTFLIGFGGGGVMASHLVYALEFLSAKWRGRYGAVPVWNVALVTFAFVVMALKNWRHVYLIFGIAAALTLLGSLWAPESLRWLYAHGKEEQSKKLIVKIMKCNRRQHDMSDILEKLKETSKEEPPTDRRYTYLDLFRSWSILRLTLKMGFLWIASNVCYYTLSFSVKAFSGDYYINLWISCLSEIPFVFLIGPCINRFGRKFTLNAFISLAMICTMSCVVVYYTASPEVAGPVFMYLAVITKGSVGILWSAMQIFSVELYPTVIRNLAMGCLNTVARLGGIIATLIIPRDQASTIICFFVLSGTLLCTFFIVLSLPETKDKPLADRIGASKEERDNASEKGFEI